MTRGRMYKLEIIIIIIVIIIISLLQLLLLIFLMWGLFCISFVYNQQIHKISATYG